MNPYEWKSLTIGKSYDQDEGEEQTMNNETGSIEPAKDEPCTD